MRTIINFLFLFTSLSTLSQNEDILAFGERFKPLEFPLVFDDLSVLDIKRHPPTEIYVLLLGRGV